MELPGERDVIWSQPPNLNGNKISSEIIGQYGLESELANDFTFDVAQAIGAIGFWGGYYNWSPGDPGVESFNIRIYTDSSCEPRLLLNQYLGQFPDVTFVGYDGNGYPTYKYELDANFDAQGGARYWFSAQATDHPFPPQWGRQEAAHPVWCNARFKSAFFGYPDWVDACNLMEPCDVSLELFDALGRPGACCYPDGVCSFVVYQTCFLNGGTWLGHGIPCDPNPCSVIAGACCVEPCNQCVVTTPDGCFAADGVWLGNPTCDPDPCDEPPGACCLPPYGSCVMLTRGQCAEQGGTFFECPSTCTPNPCSAVPVEGTTWGRIKEAFR